MTKPVIDGYTEWQSDPETVGINKLPQHATFMPYGSFDEAKKAERYASSHCTLLNGKWKFRLYENYTHRPADFAKPDYDSDDWDTITVPCSWQMQGYDQSLYCNVRYPWENQEDICPPNAPTKYNPVGCYLKRINISRETLSKRTVICFEGVESAFYLYVNGTRIENNIVKFNGGLNRVTAGYCGANGNGYGRTHLVFSTVSVEEAVIPLSMRWFNNNAILPFDCYGDDQPQTFSFTSPPALRALTIPCEGVITSVFVGSEKAELTHSGNTFTAIAKSVSALPCQVTITVEKTRGHYGGAVFSSPISLACEKGKMPAGDWSKIDGLKFYSGGATYSQTVYIDSKKCGKNAVLSVDRIVSTARTFVNGIDLGVRFAPPWEWDIGSALREGENEIRLEIFNTLGNHYEYLPTRYKSGTESGLIGGARIVFSE